MRGALRRPTGDGVLDPPLEFLAFAFVSLPNFFAGISSCTPPIILPGARAFRWADLKKVVGAPFLRQKSLPNFHSIFEGILAFKIVPKASQNEANMYKKCIAFPGVFSYRCFFNV